VEVLDNIPFKLDVDALFAKVRVEKGGEDAKELNALVETAKPLLRPKALYKVSFIDHKGDDSVEIEGVTFTTRVLRVNLDKVERVFPHVATCGKELDEIPVPSSDFFKRFWLDTIKEMALGASTRYLNQQVKKRFAIQKMSRMSPGAGAHNVWPIEQQKLLFSLFGDVEALIGVRLTPSFLMLPNKSVSGIFFPTEVTFETCRLCQREKCPSRSAPYDAEYAKTFHKNE
jgi:hypothetical protein